MKPCTRIYPNIGKKNTRELCVKTFDNKVNAVVGAHIGRNRETNGKQQLDNLTRIGSIVTHFKLPPYEFH
jgi:hypothetical protein